MMAGAGRADKGVENETDGETRQVESGRESEDTMVGGEERRDRQKRQQNKAEHRRRKKSLVEVGGGKTGEKLFISMTS